MASPRAGEPSKRPTRSCSSVWATMQSERPSVARTLRQEKSTSSWGRHAEGMIYGHYWRTKGQGSSGVLLVRETGPHAKFFRGFYTKIRRDILSSGIDTLSIANIVLDWTFEGVQD